MDEEYELVLSPLCGEIARDGVTIDVQIYRGVDDDGWVLEVIDQTGASTVWNDPFPTDQAALNEVVRTIEVEGITSFMRDPQHALH